MTLDLEPEPRQGIEVVPDARPITSQVGQGNELSTLTAKSFEQSDVQSDRVGWS
jgi:hypothetical protein